MKKASLLSLLALVCFCAGTAALAASTMDVGKVAGQVTTNVANVARLITAVSYVAGMAFVVGAIVKFKAHKENPTQIPIGTPIALLFVGAALIFIPTIFKVSGATMFGASGTASSTSGFTDFGATMKKN
jgi:intracellular multiplication protein IcmD